jgi:two-component system chemotaxis sensor kinase CheA
MNQEELQQQLLEAFTIEAGERIASMFSSLTDLEKDAKAENRGAILETVYREAHSLKGAARSVNIIPVETLCQAMESLFSALKQASVDFTPDIFDTLHTCVGVIETYLSKDAAERIEIEATIDTLAAQLSGFQEKTAVPPPDSQASPTAPHDELIFSPDSMNLAQPGVTDDTVAVPHEDPPVSDICEYVPIPADEPDASPPAQSPSSKPTTGQIVTDTVRISTAKLDALLLKTEELIILKQIMAQHIEKIDETARTIHQLKKISEKARKELRDIRGQLPVGESMEKFFKLYDLNHDQIRDTDHQLNDLAASMDHSSRQLGGMVDDLLYEVKRTSLLPFSTLFSILPRMVREISRDLGKKTDLEICGGDIEIDKRILEGLKDPLLHLIRNAIDHGVETPAERLKNGKPEWGKLLIQVLQPESSTVKIAITDDGKGIDLDKIREKAVASGILSQDAANRLTPDETIALIFQSGVSTSPLITEISGRGLGMAIVAENIEKLGGLISVAPNTANGTAFTITLPVSLSTFRGVMVSASGHDFIFPVAHLEHTLLIRPGEIRTAENQTLISLDDRPISLVSLSDLLGLPHTPLQNRDAGDETLSVVVLGTNEKTLACMVDQIIQEQEVLVKGLGKQLKSVPAISGATILGSGRVVPILNVGELIAAAAGKSFARSLMEIEEKQEKQKSLLIVEDSFTSRTLLKNILEATGYHVSTAIDGEDGFQQLKAGSFDAVISDVEMPKMNGFDLTRNIREDKLLASTPVVLVTSLDSREDRERGVDAGADAYIVKSKFDQSNLLEVLQRLM